MDHAAGEGAGVPDLHLMAEARQMIGGGKPRRPGADHQHALAARFGVAREGPAFFEREIAEIAFDRVNADGAVHLLPIAAILARMIADPAMDGGQWVVRGQNAPGGLIAPRLRLAQPGLNVLAGRTGVVARRQEIDIDRTPHAKRPRPDLLGEIGLCGQVARHLAHDDPLTGRMKAFVAHPSWPRRERP